MHSRSYEGAGSVVSSRLVCYNHPLTAWILANISFSCFVRARRLNVIIQPHLRFTYELLKWEEFQRQRRNEPLRRDLEWATVAREIALMNKPYSK
jgi:dual specificity MAP kinase phosphatase